MEVSSMIQMVTNIVQLFCLWSYQKLRNPSLMLSGSHWSWCQAIAGAEITGAGPDKILFVSVKMEHGDL